MSDELDGIARTMHRSLAITFGTTAPYAFGSIRLERTGFASIPRLIVPVTTPALDVCIPLCRQRAFAYLAERGVSDEHLAFTPVVGGSSYRRRLFTDENEASPTCGKRKYGHQYDVGFEMSKMLAGAVDWRSGTYGTLASTWERAAEPTKEA